MFIGEFKLFELEAGWQEIAKNYCSTRTSETILENNVWRTHEVCEQTYSWGPVHFCHRPLYPVDKNRSTTGGQSGPSYLQLWPQQEDSPDHAHWEACQSRPRSFGTLNHSWSLEGFGWTHSLNSYFFGTTSVKISWHVFVAHETSNGVYGGWSWFTMYLA